MRASSRDLVHVGICESRKYLIQAMAVSVRIYTRARALSFCRVHTLCMVNANAQPMYAAVHIVLCYVWAGYLPEQRRYGRSNPIQYAMPVLEKQLSFVT